MNVPSTTVSRSFHALLRASISVFCTAILFGCGGTAADDANLVTYVCRETREIVRAAAQPTPALNPETGRRTLVRGMYCEKCKAWFPVPPEAKHPETIRCRIHGVPMTLIGPTPDDKPANGETATGGSG